MNKLKTLLAAGILLCFAGDLAAQTTGSATIQATIPRFIFIDDTEFTDVTDVGGDFVAANIQTAAPGDAALESTSSHTFTLETNAGATLARLGLNLTSGTSTTGVGTNAWDDLQIQVTTTTTTTTSTQGSAAPTVVTDQPYNATGEQNIVTAIAGGSYEITVKYDVVLDNRFAREGVRDFDAVITIY